MDRRRPQLQRQPQLTPAQGKYDRVMIVLIITLALAAAVGLYFLLTTPRIARADSTPIAPIPQLEIFQTSAQATGAGSPVVIGYRFRSQVSWVQLTECVISKNSPTTCNNAVYNVPQTEYRPYAYSANSLSEPFWLIGIARFADGSHAVSPEVRIDPTAYLNDVSLALRVEVDGDKSAMFNSGDQLAYRLFLRNNGDKMPIAPVVTLRTWWNTSTMRLLGNHDCFCEIDFVRDQTYGERFAANVFVDPRGIEPDTEVELARFAYEVINRGASVIHFTTRGEYLGGGIQGNFEHIRSKYAHP